MGAGQSNLPVEGRFNAQFPGMMRIASALSGAFRPAVVLLATLALAAASGCGRRDPRTPRPDPRAIILGSDATVETVVSYPAPELTVRTLGGDELEVGSFRGRVLLVNFWATWCGPCLRELPELVHLSRDVGPERLAVVGVAVHDPDSAGVGSTVEDLGVPYPVVLDATGHIAEAFGGVFVMPTTFVVSPDGNVVRRISGLARPDSLRAVIGRLTAP